MRIVISGASSGIGTALAVHYASKGVTLGLLGRDRDRLDRVAQQCRTRQAEAVLGVFDIRDRAAVHAWVSDFASREPLDLVIANAGVMEGTPRRGFIEDPNKAYALIETNVLGVMNLVQPTVTAMVAQGRGQIAIVSSLAGFTPLADSPSYCASKSAVLAYGLSLRDLLAGKGIKVNVICPGFVETPMMLRERGPKPFKMSAARAARIIARGLASDRAVIAFPRLFAFATRINGLLPDPLRRLTAGWFGFTVD